jgi:hypothetical protein
VVRAADQEVVAQREHDVHVRLRGHLSEEGREALLGWSRVQREQLLELVDHEERLGVARAPALGGLDDSRRLARLRELGDAAQELVDRLRVAGEVRREPAGQAEGGVRPGRGVNRRPPLPPRGDDPRPQERGLARSRSAFTSWTKPMIALLAPVAVVLREGRKAVRPASELVPGDIIYLEPGDRVPADLRLLRVKNLHVDEAPLTGESFPVPKITDPLPADTPVADRRNLTFSATLVNSGPAPGGGKCF